METNFPPSADNSNPMNLLIIAHAILDLFYPRYCILCYTSLNHSDRKALCSECYDKIEFIDPATACPRCGIDLGPYVQSNTLCQECFYQPPRFNKAIAVARYEGIIKELIHKFKYGREKVLLDELSGLLAKKWREGAGFLPNPDIIIPTPLYYKKQKKRGFNQSELLAAMLGENTGIPLVSDNLVKVKDTADQAGLDAVSRCQNLLDAFGLKDPETIKGRNILLVDDVMTTGTTAGEISRLLKQNGAKTVYVFTLAR
ncbi:MAG: ComF family protein [Planctomycetota bacterium]|nr:ComF family protein [Planctomycetota bacterium]MDI6787340.1 ComF family protein [Planctomycetota bacterium]